MFAKDFNEILSEILTNYHNAGPIQMLDVARLKEERPDIYEAYLVQGDPDTSEGSILYLRAACLASAIYGLNKLADKAVGQYFYETAVRYYLEQHAADYGVSSSGKTDIQLRDELSVIKKLRLMGGNKFDYIHWAKQVAIGDESVIDATIQPLAQGEGTFDIIIMSNQNNGVPSEDLIDAVLAKVTLNRTVCSGFSWGLRVLGPQIVLQDISISGDGGAFDRVKTVSDITAYINSLKHGQTLYKSQLITIAIQNGADNAVVNTPTDDVAPVVDTAIGVYQMIRPGSIEVL